MRPGSLYKENQRYSSQVNNITFDSYTAFGNSIKLVLVKALTLNFNYCSCFLKF
jgi:hypothetical protein